MLIAYVLACIILVAAFLAASRIRPEILALYLPAFCLVASVFIILIVILDG